MADIEKLVQILSGIPMFQGLTPRQLRRVANRFVERTFAKGDEIVTQGKGGEGFFVVLEGKAEAVLRRGDGTCSLLNPLNPGDFFGELALLADTTRVCSVLAAEDAVCAVLTRWDFLGILKEDAEMAVAVLQEIAARFSRVLSTM